MSCLGLGLSAQPGAGAQGDLVLMFSDGLRDNLHDREAQCFAVRESKHANKLDADGDICVCAQVLSIVDRALPPAQAASALDHGEASESSLELTEKVAAFCQRPGHAGAAGPLHAAALSLEDP